MSRMCFESDTFSINSTDGPTGFQSTSNPFTFSPPPQPDDKTVCQTTDLFDMRFSSGSWAAPLGESFEASNNINDDAGISLFPAAPNLQESPRAPDTLDPFSTMHEQQTSDLLKKSLNIGGPPSNDLSYDDFFNREVGLNMIDHTTPTAFHGDLCRPDPFADAPQNDLISSKSSLMAGSSNNPFSPSNESTIPSSSFHDKANLQTENLFDQYLSNLVAPRNVDASSSMHSSLNHSSPDMLSTFGNSFDNSNPKDLTSPQTYSHDNTFNMFTSENNIASDDIFNGSFESVTIVQQSQPEPKADDTPLANQVI